MQIAGTLRFGFTEYHSLMEYFFVSSVPRKHSSHEMSLFKIWCI